MWGEIIEPPAPTPPPSSHESCDRPTKTVVEPVDSDSTGPLLGCEFTYTKAPHQNKQHTSDAVLQAVSSSVSTMLEAVAVSGCMVKSQQIDEAELTMQERREELLRQYQSRPLVFLERYQAYLKPKHLEAFSSLRSDSRAQHYCRVIQRRAVGRADKTRVRNQRYAALRALQRDGQYFSEEQMRLRQPLLYEQYIGQYLTDDELLVRSQEAMQEGAEGQAGGCPGEGNAGLAHLLLNSYQERLIQNRLEEEQEREEATREEDEDDDDDDGDVSRNEEWEPTAQEKVMLREEFVSQMHQRFLDGKDKDFNYSEVDENPDYDNLDIVSRDAEEKYFDDDEEEEEEEEEDDDEEENKQEEDEDDKMAE